LLTNAAGRPDFWTGPDEVIAWAGQDGSQGLSAQAIHTKAKLIIGNRG
jgi:hypothetical protein